MNKSISVSEFHNFSATMENELRLSYSRNNANTTAGDFKFPGLRVPEHLHRRTQPANRSRPQHALGLHREPVQLQENLTKTWGRHTFKAGYDAIDVILTGFFVQRARGDYDYAH